MIGKFLAKIKDYGVSKTKNGNPQVFVQFEFEAEQATKTLTWYGSFVGGAKDITLKTLITMGLSPQNFNNLIAFNNGVASGMLNLEKPLEIDVQEEPKFDEPGKMVTRIAWVNDPENPGYTVKKLNEAENAQLMGGMNFEGDLVKLYGEMGFGNGQSMNTAANPQGQGPQNQYATQGQTQTQMPPQNNNNQQQNNGYNNGQAQNNQGQQGFNNQPQNGQGQAQGNGQGGGFAAPF